MDTRAPFEAFRQVAGAYCALIEDIESQDRTSALEQLRGLLPALMSAAEQLPEIEPSEDELGPSISHEAWSERFAAINATLGEWGGYWTTMEARSATEPEVVLLPVADDLADVWRDLRGGLDALRDGATSDEATWDWRFSFQTHWGDHAAEAIRAVRAALH